MKLPSDELAGTALARSKKPTADAGRRSRPHHHAANKAINQRQAPHVHQIDGFQIQGVSAINLKTRGKPELSARSPTTTTAGCYHFQTPS
jgi:hypothetical protein